MPRPSTLLLDSARVAELLPMGECMDVMATTLASLAKGDAMLPLRTVMRLPNSSNAFGVMPAYIAADASGERAAVGVKVITVFPGNEDSALESHQGAVLLFDTTDGHLAAILDASAITNIRTAAVSGVATRALARADAGDLAILGSGSQAETHLAAMHEARPLRRVRVWSRTASRRDAFSERMRGRYRLPIEPCDSVREAVDGADIICTTTASREPVLFGEWIASGAHVNAVGASVSSARELDTAAVARARLFVDRRESALAEAGDFLLAKREGAIGDEHIRGELGEVIAGLAPGRTSDAEVTLFKSLGLAVEDVAAARHILQKAVAAGVGDRVTLGGVRDGRR